MKKILTLLSILAFTSCHENIEDRASREAKEYTERYCPTPVTDGVNTDSIAFEKATKTFHYYYTLSDKLDDIKVINFNKKKFNEALMNGLKQSTTTKAFKDAKFNFEYTYRSKNNPQQVLYNVRFTPKEYNK